MTRPEPARVGTAEEIAADIIAKAKPWFDGTAEADRRKRRALTAAITSAITASRRQAKEEDAKIAEVEASLTPIVAPLTNAAYDEAARTIAAAIRSSINPPGEKE